MNPAATDRLVSHPIVQACAVAILAGAVLQTAGVSAGNGVVIDWRTVRSGETVMVDGDAFDAAYLFVALVGDDAALAIAGDQGAAEIAPAPAPVRVPEITHWRSSNRRGFQTPEGFQVYVEPHGDDEAAARFTARLAAFSVVS